MKQYRANRRPGNRPMTQDQRLRVFDSKELVCVACAMWAATGGMPNDHIMLGCEYNHAKSGNIRIGHDAGYGLCQWHHQRHPLTGWSARAMRAHFGPSLMDGSALFHATYGTDDDLIALQNAILSAVHDGPAQEETSQAPKGMPQEDASQAPRGITQEEASQVPADDSRWSEPP